MNARLEELSALAESSGVRVASGKPLRFIAPAGERGGYGDYELRVFESGCVETRTGNRHDLFNALAWLAFPRTKAILNALHAREIPFEQGRRGRFRDLLTLIDEGGVLVSCDDEELKALVHDFRWKELFWERRSRLLKGMRLSLLGHAVLERVLDPFPGIACKVIFVPAAADPDRAAAAWLERLPREAAPRDLPPMPVFGYPGWCAGSESSAFYDDTRYFRPSRRHPGGKIAPGSRPGSRYGDIEESPGSAERDAG
jgi:hypothetical protein